MIHMKMLRSNHPAVFTWQHSLDYQIRS